MYMNEDFYKYSEKRIKEINYNLWIIITNYTNEFFSFKEKFYFMENSIINFNICYCYCGNKLKFIDMNSGFRQYCSKRCMYDSSLVKEKRKNTCIGKFGVDNPSKSEIIKDKVRETNNINLGVDYPLQSSDCKQKMKNTCINKFGVDNPSKIREIREKAESTNLDRFGFKHAAQNDDIKNDTKNYFIEKFGVDNPSKFKEIKERSKETSINTWKKRGDIIINNIKEENNKKYGKDFFTQTDEYKELITIQKFNKREIKVNDNRYKLISIDNNLLEIICNRCGSNFNILKNLYNKRLKNEEEICLNCNPINIYSKDEKNILTYIKSIYNGKIISNYKDILEIDIYLPELKLGFEYNGLYWHSEINKDINYHYNKYKYFKDKGISLVQIWENNYIYNKNNIYNYINNKININYGSIEYSIENIIDNDFLVKNSIIYTLDYDYSLGVIVDNKLVFMVTLRQNCINNFCFLEGYNYYSFYLSIISYLKNKFCDISLLLNNSSGYNLLFENLGFVLKDVNINYNWYRNKKVYYFIDEDKVINNDYYRVFDSGTSNYFLLV